MRYSIIFMGFDNGYGAARSICPTCMNNCLKNNPFGFVRPQKNAYLCAK